MPEVDQARTPPEPVAVVDAVNHQSRFEHQSVRNHRIVFGIGVLLDAEILLYRSPRVGQEGPLSTDRCTKLLECMVVVRRDRGDLGVADGDLWIERSELQMLLMFVRTVMTARQREDQWVISL